MQVAQRRKVEGGKHDQNWLRRGGLVFHFNTSAFGTMGGRRVSGRGDRGDIGGIGGRRGGQGRTGHRTSQVHFSPDLNPQRGSAVSNQDRLMLFSLMRSFQYFSGFDNYKGSQRKIAHRNLRRSGHRTNQVHFSPEPSKGVSSLRSGKTDASLPHEILSVLFRI